MTDPNQRPFPTPAMTLIEEARAARQEQQAAYIRAHARALLLHLKARTAKATDEAA
jgi:hypothetical protein